MTGGPMRAPGQRYRYLSDDVATGADERARMFGMYTPEGTDAVGIILAAALQGATASRLSGLTVDAEDLGHTEIFDTAVRDELIGNLPAGSDAQARMAEALGCVIVRPHGTSSESESWARLLHSERVVED